VTLTANFGTLPFEDIGPGCIQARWHAQSRNDSYCPAAIAMPTILPVK
jgi:hypothetical protein